jgi:predicted nucleotidyltransferase
MKTEELNAPPEIRAAIARFRDELLSAAEANLAGLVLYGGLARGRYRPGKSDINIALILKDTSVESLAKIAPVLRSAWRAVRLEPFIVNASEVARLAEMFPTKLLDIKSHNILLAGDSPFDSIEVTPAQARLRIEQSLTNLALRLRRRYVSGFDDPRTLAGALSDAAVPLKVELSALLRLAGKDEPSDSTTAAVLRDAAAAFDLDAEALAELAALRREEPVIENLSTLYDRALRSIDKVIEIVRRQE